MTESLRALLAVVCIAGVLSGCARQQESLVISHSTEEPSSSIAMSLVPLLEALGYGVEVRSEAGPLDILESIALGRSDFGIVEEPDRIQTGLTTVVPLYPSILHVLHRSEMAPTTFVDVIKDHSVFAGPVGGAGWRLLQTLAEDFGLTDADYRVLDNPWLEPPDVFFVFGGLLADADSLSEYSLFSFGEVDRLGAGTVAEAIVLKNPRLRTFVLPEATYPALSLTPTLTLSARSVLVSAETFDAGEVYRITEQILEHAQEIGASYHLVSQELTQDMKADALALPLHPGARRYLEKDRPGFIERYVDVIALVLTVLAGIGSTLLAYVRRRNTRRKDRIDVYYNRALALRARGEAASDDEQVISVEKEMRSLQQEVMGLVVEERLDANHAVAIFMTLSTQILAEIQNRKA